MRHTLNKIGLLGLCLFLSFFVVKYVSATVELEILPDEPRRLWYKSSLDTLRIGNFSKNGTLRAATNGKLRITNGLIAGGDSNKVEGTSTQYAVIGGGSSNTVSANYAGIGGGSSNTASAKYAVIGGGSSNTAEGVNAVVVGGESNRSNAGSVVVGGKDNEGLNGGVVLGGNNNTAYNNSLALGVSSNSSEGGFAWNSSALSKTASVNALNGVLIGTTNKINGVNLVVNGAVKLGGGDSEGIQGEIRSDGGCFYAYDGVNWHIINRGDEKHNTKCTSELDVGQYCNFGNTIVWHGDTMTGYAVSHSLNCNAQKLVCRDGDLYVYGTNMVANKYYPYCYKVNAN